MTQDIFTSGTIEDMRTERARRAVRAFRAMQPGLSGYARAITGRKDVSIELAEGIPRTDGKKIFFKPPIALGDLTPHSRGVCERRDPETAQQLCPACRVREEVLITIYHEIAHIVFGTFQKVSDEQKAKAVERAIEEAGSKYAARIKAAWDKVPSYKKNDYLNLSSLVSPFLPTIVNVLEDARVDEGMFKARRGTRVMFDAYTQGIFRQGIEADDGSFIKWSERPLNSQAVIGVFVLACGYKYEGWFHPDVEVALADASLRELVGRVDTLRSAEGSYNLAFQILARLRELGFCRLPEEPEDDTPQEQEKQDEQDPQQSSEDQDEADEASDGPGSDEKGDPSNGDGGSDSRDGESSEGPDGDAHNSGGSDPSGDGGASGSDTSSSDEDSDGDAESRADSGDSGNGQSGSSEDGDGEPDPSEEGSSGLPGDHSKPGPDMEREGSEGLSGGDSEESDSRESDGQPSDNRGEGNVPSDSSPSDSDSEGGLNDEDSRGDGSDQQGETTPEEGASESSGELADNNHSGDSGDGDRDADSASVDPESGGDADGEPFDDEVIDSGADEGEGGTTSDELYYGSPEEALGDVQVFSKHEAPDPTQGQSLAEVEDERAIDRAIVQGQYFEKPSANVEGVREHKYGQPVNVDGRNMSTAWEDAYGQKDEYYVRQLKRLGIETDLDIPESILGPALIEMRRTFADNQRASFERHLRSGKINQRVLGRRAWAGDDRLFQKKRLPGKKSYAVLIGIDISGSTVGVNIALAKRAAMAQAELCHRAGIDFAVYAHTANGRTGYYSSDLWLDIYEIKSFDAAWNDRAKEALDKIGSDSENLDGHTIEYYRKMIERHSTTDKVILYYSDGKMPAANHDEELEILVREINYCRAHRITLLGVGIRTDSPRKHGLDTVQVNNDSDVPKVVRHLESALLHSR